MTSSENCLIRTGKSTEKVAGSMKNDDTRQGTAAQSNPKRQNASPVALGVLELRLPEFLFEVIPPRECSRRPPFGVPGSATRRVSSISRDDRLLAAAGTVPGQGNDTYSKSV